MYISSMNKRALKTNKKLYVLVMKDPTYGVTDTFFFFFFFVVVVVFWSNPQYYTRSSDGSILYNTLKSTSRFTCVARCIYIFS